MSTRSPELETTLRDWLEAKMRGDRDLIVALLSDDAGVVAIGTAEEDWAAGPDAFAHIHSDGGAFDGTIETLEVREHGDSAWGTVRAQVRWDDEEITVRLSVVLLREPDGWRVVHTHASVAG
jgi:ketosteroid isomerase-like protein